MHRVRDECHAVSMGGCIYVLFGDYEEDNADDESDFPEPSSERFDPRKNTGRSVPSAARSSDPP